MDFKEVDVYKLLQLAMGLQSKIRNDYEDKQITVGEILDLLKTVAQELGYDDFVVYDGNKVKKEIK